MIIGSLIEKISLCYRRWRPAISASVQAPLLDAEALQGLALYAGSLPWSLAEFHQPASHVLLGETLSCQRGRGFEFEENRAYQSGDEPRLLNWRQYARSGELYTKIFIEERRPQVFLLLDRRATMRFATQRQLKVALAAKITACYAFQAQQQALPVGGLILNQTADWFAPALGLDTLQTLIQSLTAPCPPLDFNLDQPMLEQCLQWLVHRLPAGCFVLLLSDFADLDADRAQPLLHQLSMQHTLRAIQILDPVEQNLPESSDFFIDDPSTVQPLLIDGRDPLQRSLYDHAFREHQSKLVAGFSACGISFKTCTTQDDLSACLEPPHATSPRH